MKLVEPRIYIWSELQLNKLEIARYLESIGSDFDIYSKEEANDGELLVEVMGRLCYKSWQPLMNPNVTAIREDSKLYLKNILQSRHGSVLEHVNISFAFENVSRVLTHELVRHRVGTAFSQESMRYVRPTDIPVWIPPSLCEDLPEKEAEEFQNDVEEVVSLMEFKQAKWTEKFELNTSRSFTHKKRITSALRRFFTPTGIATHIGFTCNIRELRHTIHMRTAISAEEEIRLIFAALADEMADRYPYLFSDMNVNVDREYWFEFDQPEIAMADVIDSTIRYLMNTPVDAIDLDRIKSDLISAKEKATR